MDDMIDYKPTAADVEGKHSHLAVQDLSKLNLDTLTPETHEVISRQATLNIGTIGHVAHGKSTVVRAVTQVRTGKSAAEADRNITIHLGYANAKIYRSTSDKLEAPANYYSYGSSHPDDCKCPATGEKMELVRHVSFVDCPGHDVLMSTMLNGAAIMDAALLLIAANETFPQPQTLEHLKAVEIMKLNQLLVLQNKIDLVDPDAARSQHTSIAKYFESTVGLDAPIIPISAQLLHNIDMLLYYICHIPIPRRNLKSTSQLVVVRSFDVNSPGSIADLKGGVAGGSLMKGVMKKGQEIEIRPGLVERSESGAFTCRAFRTNVVSIFAEGNPLEYAIPGGLIAIGTNIDPSLTRQNKLVGQMLGDVGGLPSVYVQLDVVHSLLSQIVSAKKQTCKVNDLTVGEKLQVNIGTLTVAASVLQVNKALHITRLVLESPACCTMEEKITISRRYETNFRLIGWATIRRGVTVEMLESK